MIDEYIYVKITHRVWNPHLKDYMILSKYLEMMRESHGLLHDSLAPFDIPEGYNCFKVLDKGKALIFCLNNGEQILKPEKTKNDLLRFR